MSYVLILLNTWANHFGPYGAMWLLVKIFSYQDHPTPHRCWTRCTGCAFFRELTTRWLCWLLMSAALRRCPTSIAYSRTERTSTICDDDRPLQRCADRSPRQQSLPKTVLDSDTVTSFTSRLKTHLFSQAFSHTPTDHWHTTWPKRLWSYDAVALLLLLLLYITVVVIVKSFMFTVSCSHFQFEFWCVALMGCNKTVPLCTATGELCCIYATLQTTSTDINYHLLVPPPLYVQADQ